MAMDSVTAADVRSIKAQQYAKKAEKKNERELSEDAVVVERQTKRKELFTAGEKAQEHRHDLETPKPTPSPTAQENIPGSKEATQNRRDEVDAAYFGKQAEAEEARRADLAEQKNQAEQKKIEQRDDEHVQAILDHRKALNVTV